MLKIYLSNEQGLLQEKTEITTGCWINLISPTEQEIHHVADQLKIPLEFLKDPLDEEERSRIEKDDDNILIIVNIPLMTMDENEIPIYDTIPLGIIIAKQLLCYRMLKRQSDFPYFFRKKSKELFHFQKNKIFLSNPLYNVNILS